MFRDSELHLVSSRLVLAAAPPLAQTDYPSKPVRIIVPFGAGGAADTLPRLLAQYLAPMWGQPVVVENRTGAAGNIGMELGARAAPDGYTLTSAPVGNLAINPHLYSKLTFDVLKDFTPITLVASVQNVLVLNPAVPANDLKELIAYAKARPGKLTYGSGGVGTQAHIGGEIFESMADLHLVHVAYKGVGDSVRDLLGGQIDMIFAQIPAVKPHIDSGKLRALGRREPEAHAGAAERADDRRGGRARGVPGGVLVCAGRTGRHAARGRSEDPDRRRQGHPAAGGPRTAAGSRGGAGGQHVRGARRGDQGGLRPLR